MTNDPNVNIPIFRKRWSLILGRFFLPVSILKTHPGATTEDISAHLKPEIRKKPYVVIIHAGINGLTSNSRSLENYKRMVDSVRSKLPNCKLAISNVVTRKDKSETDKKVETFNTRFSKIFKKNEIDRIDNKHIDDSCLNSSSISTGKVILILQIIVLIISIVDDTKNSFQFLIAAMFLR